MSCYTCNQCGGYKDADFDGCEVDPGDSTELVCVDCYEKDYNIKSLFESLEEGSGG